MMQYIDVTGKTTDDAIAAALAQLGMDRDDVSVEILEREKSGFLGLGSSPAKVRVSYEVPGDEKTAEEIVAQIRAAVPEQPAAPVKERFFSRKEKEAAPVAEEAVKEEAAPVAEAPAAAPKAPAAASDKSQRAEEFLTGLLAQLGSTAVPEISETAEGNLKVDLVGQNLGALIGRRGETLDAIQQLTSYVVNRGAGHRVKIHLDAENYRAKREESLERLAVKMAEKAVRYRKSMMLEPMNAYERHVIHTALQENSMVTTHSVGTEPNRRIVISLQK